MLLGRLPLQEKVRVAHNELLEQDFMTKLSDLPEHLQEFSKTADFNYYYCWQVVYKEDSQSTPVRLVVDPTMSGLNISQGRKQSWKYLRHLD